LKKHPAVRLDETLTLEDTGVSAFRGKHRDTKHALGQFLKFIETGSIPKGSILLLENLDRLSREEVGEAVELFLSIVNRGIVVVQLVPNEQVFAKPVDLTAIVLAVVELARGGSESAAKSARVSSKWSERKRLAAAGKGIITARAPAWLQVVDGKFRFRRGARETIQRIVSLCAGGMGCRLITTTFNREAVPTWGKIPRWEEAYVRKIVRSRAIIGEHQAKAKGEADGPPIPNYYPPAVTEREFLAAQGALAGRNNRGGRPPAEPEHVNPFAALLRLRRRVKP
jgi:DNA invertase Pin-like site-specific DNA recombinase